jgi:hypothetical protein
MNQICSIDGCNKPIVIKQKGDEYLECCEEHIDEVRDYFEERYNREQQELYEFWSSEQ